MKNERSFEITLIRSKRKTIQVEIKNDMSVIVRAPRWVPMGEIDRFIDERTDWIEEHLSKIKERIDDLVVSDKYSDYEIQKLTQNAKEVIPPLVAELAQKMGVTFDRVSIKCQKSVWGSCSAKGNLNFNCLLMLLPEEVMKYVIIHELCHLRHLDHSSAFWKEVEKNCPDHKYLRQFLKDNGEKVLLRL